MTDLCDVNSLEKFVLQCQIYTSNDEINKLYWPNKDSAK